jgi:hypothetical protein
VGVPNPGSPKIGNWHSIQCVGPAMGSRGEGAFAQGPCRSHPFPPAPQRIGCQRVNKNPCNQGGATTHAPPGSEPGWCFPGRHDARHRVLLMLPVAGQVAVTESEISGSDLLKWLFTTFDLGQIFSARSEDRNPLYKKRPCGSTGFDDVQFVRTRLCQKVTSSLCPNPLLLSIKRIHLGEMR